MRAFITICSAKGWKEHSIDAKSAFLQSEGIGREVYLTPPKEAKSDRTVLWKLENAFMVSTILPESGICLEFS